jgi:hypothetical protein
VNFYCPQGFFYLHDWLLWSAPYRDEAKGGLKVQERVCRNCHIRETRVL